MADVNGDGRPDLVTVGNQTTGRRRAAGPGRRHLPAHHRRHRGRLCGTRRSWPTSTATASPTASCWTARATSCSGPGWPGRPAASPRRWSSTPAGRRRAIAIVRTGTGLAVAAAEALRPDPVGQGSSSTTCRSYAVRPWHRTTRTRGLLDGRPAGPPRRRRPDRLRPRRPGRRQRAGGQRRRRLADGAGGVRRADASCRPAARRRTSPSPTSTATAAPTSWSSDQASGDVTVLLNDAGPLIRNVAALPGRGRAVRAGRGGRQFDRPVGRAGRRRLHRRRPGRPRGRRSRFARLGPAPRRRAGGFADPPSRPPPRATASPSTNGPARSPPATSTATASST